MIIKVCGMREAQNIKDVAALGVDIIGLIFYPKSKRYVSQIPTRAGIIPDRPSVGADLVSARPYDGNDSERADTRSAPTKPALCGVFVDDMPQTILTRVVNYGLSYVQLHGDESPVMIENLKRTLIPDFVPEIGIIKALSIEKEDDVKRWRDYEGLADYLIFDTRCKTVGGSGEHFNWQILDAYDGNIPFLLSGGIGPDDIPALKAFRHPMLAGYDLNSRFEDKPGVKNVETLKSFLNAL